MVAERLGMHRKKREKNRVRVQKGGGSCNSRLAQDGRTCGPSEKDEKRLNARTFGDAGGEKNRGRASSRQKR